MKIHAAQRLLGSAWQGHFKLELPDAVREEIHDIMNKLSADFPTLAHINIEAGDPEWMENILATKSLTALYLNAHYFQDPEKLRVHFENWKGLQVEPTLTGTIIHECGHILANQVLQKAGARKFNNVLKKHLSDLNGIWNYESPSSYGQENTSEFLAEAFVAHYLGKHAWDPIGEFGTMSMATSNAVWTAMRKLLK
jgi:hypothetical protein